GHLAGHDARLGIVSPQRAAERIDHPAFRLVNDVGWKVFESQRRRVFRETLRQRGSHSAAPLWGLLLARRVRVKNMVEYNPWAKPRHTSILPATWSRIGHAVRPMRRPCGGSAWRGGS